MRRIKWIALALVLALGVGCMALAEARDVVSEPVEVEVAPADTVIGQNGLTVEGDGEAALDPLAGDAPDGADAGDVEYAVSASAGEIYYARSAANAPMYFDTATGEKLAELKGGEVVLVTGACDGYCAVAVNAGRGIVEGFMRAGDLSPMDEAQVDAYQSDAAASGSVALYADDLNWPLAVLSDATRDAAFSVMANYTEYDNDKVFTINGKEISAGMIEFAGNGNCWRWAQNMYKLIWGCQFNEKFEGTASSGHNLLRNLGDEERRLTPEHLKRFVSNTKPGATIRVCGCSTECPQFNNDGLKCGHKGHSLIIADMNEDGVITLDTHSGSRHTRFYSWQGFCNSWKNYTYIKYIKWPNAPALSPQSTEQEAQTVKTVAVTGVALDRAYLALVKGDSFALTAAVAPEDATNKQLSWESSDAAVATAEGGKVVAVASGTCTITVTTKDGAKQATCEVKVLPEKGTKSLKKTGSNGTVKMMPGQKLQLIPTFATKKGWKIKSVAFSVSGVATIDKAGLVTAVAEGKTVLAVRTKNGKVAKLTLQVVDPTKPTKVVLSKNGTVKLKKGGKLKLYAKLSPVTAVGAVTWKSSNESVASVDQAGNVVAKKKGTCYVGAVADNGVYARVKLKVYG